jgi:hypothetical protein
MIGWVIDNTGCWIWCSTHTRLSIDENEITNSFAVFTALASTSYVDQSHAYTFSVAGIPKFLWNSKVTVKKKLVHKDVVYYLQNALKPTYEHLEFEKFFRGLYPRTPVQRGREWEGRNRGEEVEREGRAEGWEGKIIEGKGREWKGRGGRKRVGKGWTPRGPGPPKFLG